MNTKHILSSITLSLGLLGATATWAQDAVNPTTTTEQSQTRTERQHKKLDVEQIQDIGPIYEQLKKDGYTKIASIRQGHRGIVATVVNAEGKVVRLKQENGKNEFTVWEHKKDGKHQHRRHRGDKSEPATSATEQNT